MNTFRLRVVKISEHYGASSETPFALQASQTGLEWMTFGRFKSFDEAAENGKSLYETIMANFLIKPTHVLWSIKL